MCLRKVRFPDEHVARARVLQLYDLGRASKSKLFVYHCPNCRGWHMTSKKHHDGRHQLPPVTADNIYADDLKPDTKRYK